MTYFGAECDSRVINKLLDKILQKLSAIHSKEKTEPSRHLKKRGPEATVSFASPKIHT